MKNFKNIVVLTGAGISAESGVPVFRGDDGLWEGHPVEEVATAEAVIRDRWGVNDFFNGLREKAKKVKPNPAHEALAKLEDYKKSNFLLVTQNIDPLHERAGSKNLIHMHGEIFRIRCDFCGADYPFQEGVNETTACQHCGTTGFLRPDIVFFGEMPMQMERIIEALSHCDLFIAIGTSGVVYPAAGFVDLANRAGAYTIEINTAETERSPAFQEHLVGTAGLMTPSLIEKLITAE